MEIKRKIELTVTTNRRYIIHQSTPETQVNCVTCNEEMLKAEQSAKLFGITQRRIFQIIETGAAHFTETEAGALMICIKSLSIFLEADERK